ncbi:MAG: sulfurtransferase-like selenium metabolism protein YedF [Coriobacteriales bacterium]|jgi:selenium metabolism protein YedF|nr:sulfurtransferase-like selenium metabolism protein YedF [Coriobacteriales bacterium]
MSTLIDARGDACPLPVVKAKRALAELEQDTLEVVVDNETATQNLTRFAQAKGCPVTSEKRSEDEYRVFITKGQPSVKDGSTGSSQQAPDVPGGRQVVVISANTMGSGDDALGRTLLKGFVFALTQLDTLPKAVLLYNGGVRLACEGSESLDDLSALAAAGVEVASCGACLSYYGLTEKLAVGQVTNMYAIVEAQMAASAILRP